MRTKDLFRTFARAAKPSSVRCQCAQSVYWCTICMGNVYHTQMPDPSSQERRHCLALLDSAYHQVLSNKEEEPLSARILQKLLDRSWQIEALNRSHNITGIYDLLASEMPSADGEVVDGEDVAEAKEKDSEVERKRRLALRRRRERDRRRKRLRLKAFAGEHGQLMRRKLSVHHYSDGNDTAMHDLSTLDDGSSYESANDTAMPSPSLLSKQAWAELIRRRRETSFDIDNIIIPQSLMASTRVEKLKYKEILTPSWRLANGAADGAGHPGLDLDEDVADSSYRLRHAQAEVEERRRWQSSVTSSGAQRGSRVSRRRDSNNCLEDAILSGGNTPDPLSPAPCSFSVDPEDSCTRPSTPGNSSTADDSTSSRPRSSSFLQSSNADESSNPPPGAPPPHRLDTPSFELRSFPLAEDDVTAMEAEMPEEYLQICRRESQDGSASAPSDAAAE
jgi:KAT8 regulatory NSL complex subunit 1